MTDGGVEAVLFDLDGTVCDYRRSSRELLAEAFDIVDVDPFFAVEDYLDTIPEVVGDFDTKAELRAACFAELAREAGRDPAVGRTVADAYAAERNHSDVEFLPGARAALDALADDHRLGLVTNGGPDTQDPKLDTLDLRDAFEVVVYAGFEASAKPDPEPFHLALDGLDADAGRTVHVGNSLETDVRGAHRAGVASAWLADGDADPDPHPHYVLDSMADLTDPPWARNRP